MAAIELGAPYYLYNPAQSDYIAINVPGDANFIGYVSDITGLDSPEIRENAQNVNAGDGGIHGPFWKGRRPWTISGFIMPTNPITARSAAVEHLEAILIQCLKSDGWLMWTQANGITKYIPFRYQQPMRDTKGQSNVQRNFIIAGVAADPRILGWTQHNVSQAISNSGAGVSTALPTVINNGNTDASFTFVVTGPTNGFTIVNNTTGKQIAYSANVAAGHTVTVDLTGRWPTVIDGTTDMYGSINIFSTDWTCAVAQGNNTFSLVTSAAGTGTNAQILWRDAWS